MPIEAETYPCHGCQIAPVTMRDFSKALFGATNRNKENEEKLLNKSVRAVLHWINSKRPMSPHDFRRAIGFACKEGWLDINQGRAIFFHSIEQEAVGSVIRQFVNRLSERVSFLKTGMVKQDPDLLADEMQNATTKLMDEMLEKGRKDIGRSPAISNDDKEVLLELASTPRAGSPTADSDSIEINVKDKFVRLESVMIDGRLQFKLPQNHHTGEAKIS